MTVHFNVEKTNFKNCTLLTGFHGVGEVGYISISYLVGALKAERIGFIEVDNPPPFINTGDGGIVTPFEIYKSKKFVLVKLEFSPHKTEESEFIKSLAQWTIKEKFRDAILIGGLDSSFKTGKDKCRIAPTRSYLKELKSFKAPTLETGLLVFGPLAIILSEFEISDFPALAILPYASALTPDPGAAAVAIREISRAYNLKVNVSELEKDAENIEAEIEQKLERAQKSLHSMYV
jgi:uncharacterized protein